jgi:hypothetical protein
MYGTDWCMPESLENSRAYLLSYQRAFCYRPLRARYADFFFNNAARYLNISVRKSDPKLPHAVRDRLATLAKLVGS